jgi:hypothetical protein
MKKSFFRLATGSAMAALVVCLLGAPAQALVQIAPGGTVSPSPDANLAAAAGAGSTLVAGPLTVTGNTTNAGGSYSLQEQVFKGAGVNAPYYFLFQVINTGTTTITNLDVINYSSYLVAVGYLSAGGAPAGFNPGTVGISTVNRGASGSDLDFTFSGSLAAGATSNVFLAQANSTSFNQQGDAILADTSGGLNGGATINSIYQPAGTAVPEPSSMILIGCFAAVTSVGMLRRRARANNA